VRWVTHSGDAFRAVLPDGVAAWGLGWNPEPTAPGDRKEDLPTV
jgi:hypothetical protein